MATRPNKILCIHWKPLCYQRKQSVLCSAEKQTVALCFFVNPSFEKKKEEVEALERIRIFTIT